MQFMRSVMEFIKSLCYSLLVLQTAQEGDRISQNLTVYYKFN